MSELTPALEPAAPRHAASAPLAGASAKPLSPAHAPATLALGSVLSFSAPGLFGAAMGLVVAVFLTKFYMDVVLVPAGILALAMSVGRAIDAVIDPFIGYLSDHTMSRWGRRKPWILAGVLGNAVAYYALLTPPPSLSPRGVVFWYGTSFMLSFLCTAMSVVPRQALSVEMTFHALDRQRLYGITAGFIALGTIVGALMPSILAALGVAEPRAQMARSAQIYVTGYLATNVLLLLTTRERPEFAARGRTPFVPGVRRAMRNKPFRVMFSSHVVTAIPMAMPAVMMPFFVQYVLRLDTLKWTGIYLLSYLASGFVCLPLWMAVARRIGKRAAWLVLSFISLTGLFGLLFVNEGDQVMMLVLELYVGSPFAAYLFLAGAMHADVVDYDELHTGSRREAQFSAMWSIVPKFALIPGAAIPLAVLGSVGYVPNAATQSEGVVLAMRMLFAVVPTLFNAVGLGLMWWYPLTEEKHAAILLGVQRHTQGLDAIDPIDGAIVPPPQRRAVDDATGWFLDYFTRRELAQLAARGRSPLGSVIVKACACGALMLIAGSLAFGSIQRFDVNPGPLPTLGIVVAGLALSACLFHVLRIKPALRARRALRTATLDGATIRRHLEATT